jgi:hypothetical protein
LIGGRGALYTYRHHERLHYRPGIEIRQREDSTRTDSLRFASLRLWRTECFARLRGIALRKTRATPGVRRKHDARSNAGNLAGPQQGFRSAGAFLPWNLKALKRLRLATAGITRLVADCLALFLRYFNAVPLGSRASPESRLELPMSAEPRHRHYVRLSLLVDCLPARLARIGAITPVSQFSGTLGTCSAATSDYQMGRGRPTFSERR